MLPLIDEEFLLIIYTVVLPEKISLYTGQKKTKQKATKCFVVLHLKTASFADAPIPIPVSGVNPETGVDCSTLLLKYEPILRRRYQLHLHVHDNFVRFLLVL